MPDRLLTLKEVRDQLQVSTATIYRLVERGNLPRPLKFGSLSRWRPSDLAAAIKAAEQRRAAE
jgi:excisionase family DNA binding protein